MVAQLVPGLRLSFDETGRVYINNVRVNGILPKGDNGWYLLSILNSPISNYIFKWRGKPKDNGYFEANKQFIAPLPIPTSDRKGRAALSALAKGMQERRTLRVTHRADLDERLNAIARTSLPLERILLGVRAVAEIEEASPRSVPATERKTWVDEQRAADEEAALARIDGLIHAAAEAATLIERGKLSFLIDEQEVARLFVDEEQSALIEAQWRAVALDFEPTGKGDAARLIARLRRVAVAADAAVAQQIVGLGNKLERLTAKLRHDEDQLHELTCLLFNLSDEERRLVEHGR